MLEALKYHFSPRQIEALLAKQGNLEKKQLLSETANIITNIVTYLLKPFLSSF